MWTFDLGEGNAIVIVEVEKLAICAHSLIRASERPLSRLEYLSISSVQSKVDRLKYAPLGRQEERLVTVAMR